MGIRKTTIEFILDAEKIHGDRYDYSLVDYKGNKINIDIICRKHGVFKVRPDHFLRGHGCKKCSDEKEKYNTLTTEEFIRRSKEIHGDRYDYSLVDYKGIHKNVKIICPIHGVFEQLPNNHLKKLGCSKCSNIRKLSKEEFILKANDIHDNKYNYDLVEYINNRTKVKIICPVHGEFLQSPVAHMRNQGCPKCKRSKGEENIEKFLIRNNIKYITQHTFDDCVDKIKLHFDFYLPEYNACIEFDGRQHYHIIVRFGGEKEFLDRQRKDNIKNIYCLNNDIKMYRIRYDENLLDKLNLIYNEMVKNNNNKYVKKI